MVNQSKSTNFLWAVVGAGPAGIAAVGKLLDDGIAAQQILWLDPDFTVGDLGKHWSNVSSNTRVRLFTQYFMALKSFAYQEVASRFAINQLDPNKTCQLGFAVEPLQWITTQLKNQVVSVKTHLRSLSLSNRMWHLTTATEESFQAKNVILATGAVPANLSYPDANCIPFETAIDKQKLAESIDKNHTFAVFGSSHSAVIILRYLVEFGVKKIINFYRSPCRYAVDMGDWILFDNTGLKGQTAVWAHDYLDGNLPDNLVRYNTSEANLTRYLPECDTYIYAVGFVKRANIVIGDYEDTQYNPHVGIIGPGLFGFGIAYPELKADRFGTVESQVGMWKFMTYLNQVMPVWHKYST